MDLMSSPALALKMSKEDFDPDSCKLQDCGVGNDVVHINCLDAQQKEFSID